MSAATKRKHVTHEIFYDMVLPEPPMFIARVISNRGNNLVEVETVSGERFLASMPTKYRKHIWVKHGSYVLCEPIEEGKKVKAEIFRILFNDNIEHIVQNGLWPEVFPLPFKERNSKKDDYELDLPPSDSDFDSSDDDEQNDEEETDEDSEQASSSPDLSDQDSR
ncbi:putative RNA-binding protein EIF1AD [Trichinella pseudospiralis]|uniref:Probable RNA-binding protein EIF1AD n=2 Tax=Trichinella pseudospiralis TaxID=6337 RepID=A0A0V1J841_TRIPS|nr:putative RNA-binding protein EIF1AD [Trichinella pseudospiralis]KRY75100.1 putative RNA-binding protein EIF1AD [Trichinella pseudospiralis]KRY93378.1 putative RNA-binding protein EIF1AD [Trichinella pseudospiralis]KRZ31119.1 putative RNA-binding protein EIF1AD [Trichinella pseudospiralis]KRZ43448.1 putative RNA-binding protein EIF1AD [Trichinella pseudospiralis]